MVWRVCEHPDRHAYDTSSVRSVAFGGSPSADELQRMVHDTFPNVTSTTNAYGLTETSSVATAITGQDAIDKPTSVGQPVPTVSLKIVDADGQDLGVGETGEVCISGPILMAGYWKKPEATADAIDADGWLHTGDIGHVDEEGFLFITDRKKDMIIRGGENIYSVEIEQRLVNHPEIADAAIYGVPHPELGEEVKATVQLEAGRAHRGRREAVGRRRAGRLQGARPTSTSPSTSSPATPAASCSRTSSAARATSASRRRCSQRIRSSQAEGEPAPPVAGEAACGGSTASRSEARSKH